jgi:hypothetical protein
MIFLGVCPAENAEFLIPSRQNLFSDFAIASTDEAAVITVPAGSLAFVALDSSSTGNSGSGQTRNHDTQYFLHFVLVGCRLNQTPSR